MKLRFPPDNQQFDFELISQDSIVHLINESVKEGIIANEGVQYCALTLDNDIKTIGGFIIKGHTALFKGDYTPESLRTNGYAKKLLFARLAFVQNEYNVKKVIANCTKMSLKNYLSIGFKASKQYKNGITSVVFTFKHLSYKNANI